MPPDAISIDAQYSIGMPRDFQFPMAATDTSSCLAKLARPPAAWAAWSITCGKHEVGGLVNSMTQYNTNRVSNSTPRVHSFCVESHTMKTIGERIRQAREALKLSGEGLAKRVGYKNQSAIGNLENRAGGTGGNKLAVIADALHVPVEWLLCGPDADNVPFLPSQVPPGEPQQPDADKSAQEVKSIYQIGQKVDNLATELLELFSQLDNDGKAEFMSYTRGFVAGRRPHSYGTTSDVADKKTGVV